MPEIESSVAVIGGGIAGATTVLSLLERGYSSITLYESSPDLTSSTSSVIAGTVSFDRWYRDSILREERDAEDALGLVRNAMELASEMSGEERRRMGMFVANSARVRAFADNTIMTRRIYRESYDLMVNTIRSRPELCSVIVGQWCCEVGAEAVEQVEVALGISDACSNLGNDTMRAVDDDDPYGETNPFGAFRLLPEEACTIAERDANDALLVSGCDDESHGTNPTDCHSADHGYQNVKYRYYGKEETRQLVGDFVLDDPNVACSLVEQRLTGHVKTEKLFGLIESMLESSPVVHLKLGCFVNGLESNEDSSISVLSSCSGGNATSSNHVHAYDAVIVSNSVASVPLLDEIDPDLGDHLISIRGNGLYGSPGDGTPTVRNDQRGRAVVFQEAGSNRRAAYSRATETGNIKIWGGLFVNTSNFDIRPPYTPLPASKKEELFNEPPAPITSKILYEAGVPMESCVRPVPSLGAIPLIKRYEGKWSNLILNTGYGFNGYDLAWFSSNCAVSMLSGDGDVPATCRDAQFANAFGTGGLYFDAPSSFEVAEVDVDADHLPMIVLSCLFVMAFVSALVLRRKGRSKLKTSNGRGKILGSLGCARRDFAELQYISALHQTQRIFCPPVKIFSFLKRLRNGEDEQDKTTSRELFRFIDANGDGLLQKSEILRATEIMLEDGRIDIGSLTVSEFVDKIMRVLDVSGDDQIDIDEFLAKINEAGHGTSDDKTGSKVRGDCSIRDFDIRLFLRSRYNTVVGSQVIRQKLLPGLTIPPSVRTRADVGVVGDEDAPINLDSSDKIDLAELTAILLMPTVLKTASEEYPRVLVSKQKATRKLSLSSQQSSVIDDFEDNIAPMAIDYGDNAIEQVLLIILRDIGHNTTSSPEPGDQSWYPVLDRDILRLIFQTYGEAELTSEEELLDQLIGIGRGGVFRGVGDEVRLTPETFARLLTSDILSMLNAKDVAKSRSMTNIQNQCEGVGKFNFTTKVIDTTAVLFNKKTIPILLWVFMSMFFLAEWISQLGSVDGFYVQSWTDAVLSNLSCSEEEDFGCKVASYIALWCFRCVLMIVIGGVAVWGGSLGNGITNTFRKNVGTTTISVVLLFTVGILPFVLSDSDSDSSNEIYWYAQFVSFAAIASIIVVYLVVNIGPLLTKNQSSLSAGAEAELATERAAGFKIDRMVANALDLHSHTEVEERTSQSSHGTVVMKFQALSASETPVEDAAKSSFVCWQRLFSGDLFFQDGVQLSARFLAINAIQVFVGAFIILLGIKLTRYTVAVWEEGQLGNLLYGFLRQGLQLMGYNLDAMTSNLCQDLTTAESIPELVAEFSSIETFDQATCEAMFDFASTRLLERAFNSISPENKSMIVAPMAVSITIAAIYTLFLSIIFIPSVVSTTLRFRSGIIPFFSDANNFHVYRERMDRPSELVGTMFWTTVLGPIVFGTFWGVFLFLLMWQVTRGIMLSIIASLLGVSLTFGFRWIFGLTVVDSCARGFYRKRVNQFNLGSLVVESVMIGLGIALALFRALVCMSISLFYIARADRLLFDSEITIGLGHPLLRTRDHLPVSFRKEILLQEAHRHPYIEVLGKMYMMKLRYQERFGNRAGCSMRLIFAEALMPWLRRYREIARRNVDPDTAAWLGLTSTPQFHLGIKIGRDDKSTDVDESGKTASSSRHSSLEAKSSDGVIETACVPGSSR